MKIKEDGGISKSWDNFFKQEKPFLKILSEKMDSWNFFGKTIHKGNSMKFLWRI